VLSGQFGTSRTLRLAWEFLRGAQEDLARKRIEQALDWTEEADEEE